MMQAEDEGHMRYAQMMLNTELIVIDRQEGEVTKLNTMIPT